MQRRRVRAGTFGKYIRRCRARRELIGDPQHRGGIQCLGDPEPAQEQDHLIDLADALGIDAPRVDDKA